MGRSLKSVLIAGGVLLVLGIVLAVVLLTAPKEENSPSDSLPIDLGWDEDDGVNITKHFVDSALRVYVKNDESEFEIVRDSRTNSEGDDEYFWKTDALGNVAPDELQLKYFVETFAGLVGDSVVEEGTDDLAKYGLEPARAVVELDFDDGISAEVRLGIHNPLKEDQVYCQYLNTVYLVSYSTVEKAFGDARGFAELTLTESYDEEIGYPEFVKIDNSDETVELYPIADSGESDEAYSRYEFRMTSPFTIEIDPSNGGTLYSGLCGLRMSACEYLEKTEENLTACGLDSPKARVSFRYNGEDRELLIGNRSENGYYAVLSGREGIFSLAEDRTPWVDIDLFTVISKRPVTAYIYHCDSVEATLPDAEYKFTIDSENKRFYLNGNEVDATMFRELYSEFTGAFGEELYTSHTDGESALTIRFNYKSEYSELYGGSSDELAFHSFDGRKYTVNLNGRTIFKVGGITVAELIESIKALADTVDG